MRGIKNSSMSIGENVTEWGLQKKEERIEKPPEKGHVGD